MELIGLIILGAAAGFAADLLDKKHDNSWVANIVLGTIGALLGGLLRGVLTGTDYLALDIWSFVWALVGALIVLAIYHAAVRPRIDRPGL